MSEVVAFFLLAAIDIKPITLQTTTVESWSDFAGPSGDSCGAAPGLYDYLYYLIVASSNACY